MFSRRPQSQAQAYQAPPPAQYQAYPPQQAYGHHSHPSQSQGYGGGYSNAPPPGADPQLWNYFCSVDQDRSGSISVTELQTALVNGNWTAFDLDTIKMLMNIFDTDRSGTIGFKEFNGLWKYVTDWQNVFRHFDRDRSGSIEGRELAEAMAGFGYNLSPALLALVEQKYSSAPSDLYSPPPGITFDRFVRACVVVKQLTEAFQRIDTDRDGWVQINYEQFMKIVLSAP